LSAQTTNNHLIQSAELVKTYSGKDVVKGVSIHVSRGEIVGLLGPNGAGKTTTFYMITGLVKPNSGLVFLDGDNVTNIPMYQRARLGMGYLAQEPSIFRRLTVEQNIRAVLQTVQERNPKERLEELLHELKIDHLRKQKAYTLSGGERRRLEITRALVTRPSIILLDEPFAGVDPKSVQDVQEILRDLRNSGLGILITDHQVRETLEVVDRAYIMFEGEILVDGDSETLANDPKARELYLGARFSM